ncbi:uncharacterized protein LOC132552223 [Ylistrum balloti]|uniref:uncharacterized protein LOC132552223 n=1 Tax=Ylistrum balloti TaxID=509963 RepID=UPI002905F68E|nr:uncharacterized protein LOC132552223 [Ylistrum balloti]
MDRVMSVKITDILTISLFLLLTLRVTLAYPFGLQNFVVPKEPAAVDQSEYWNELLDDGGTNVPKKRGCVGFPCVYTHMAERAGRASIERYIAKLIEDCMNDDHCNPGKRKRRSLVKLLKQRR